MTESEKNELLLDGFFFGWRIMQTAFDASGVDGDIVDTRPFDLLREIFEGQVTLVSSRAEIEINNPNTTEERKASLAASIPERIVKDRELARRIIAAMTIAGSDGSHEFCLRLASEADLPSQPRPIRWNGHDDNREREFYGLVPRTKRHVGFKLTWRPNSRILVEDAELIGYFLLDMEGLLQQEYIRLENAEKYQLRIVHRTKEIYIEQKGHVGTGFRIGMIGY